MHNETTFDTNRDHIHLEVIIANNNGLEFSVDAILLDTGAPNTEFSNLFLEYAGFINPLENKIEIKTQGNHSLFLLGIFSSFTQKL